MPAGFRRRTPGLRREEVAQLAGVGVTWYTWLEQGRPINVSAQVLEAVARTLRLDHVEREHLFRLAGVPPVAGPPAHDRLEPQVQAVLDAIGDLPAAVMNSRYDVLAWNRAYAAMWPQITDDGIGNLLWVFRHSAVGEVRLSVVGFAIVATPGTRMSVYTTVDEESRERFDWLLAHPDAPAVDPAHRHGR